MRCGARAVVFPTTGKSAVRTVRVCRRTSLAYRIDFVSSSGFPLASVQQTLAGEETLPSWLGYQNRNSAQHAVLDIT